MDPAFLRSWIALKSSLLCRGTMSYSPLPTANKYTPMREVFLYSTQYFLGYIFLTYLWFPNMINTKRNQYSVSIDQLSSDWGRYPYLPFPTACVSITFLAYYSWDNKLRMNNASVYAQIVKSCSVGNCVQVVGGHIKKCTFISCISVHFYNLILQLI